MPWLTTPAEPEKLIRLHEKLTGILRICQKMNAQRDLGLLFDHISREAVRLMEADRASLFVLTRDKTQLLSIVSLDAEPIRFDARLGLAGAAALTGEVIRVKDAYEDPRFHRETDIQTGYRTQSVLVVPLRNHEGEILGAFEVLNKTDGVFTEEDEEILKALAGQAATAIETVQLLEELRRDRDELVEENTQLRKEVEKKFSTENIIGLSSKIQDIVRTIERVSDTQLNVLVTGESGTGKELVVKAIHYNSSRARAPFVALNCAALPESLVESELFGIEKGVATGVEHRKGKFEAADGGTLFLDEVGDLSPVTQAKLLRVLQERRLERVGGRKEIPVDVRVLAATNGDLEEMIKKGTFRQDLYYRLNVIHIQLPSLREMQEDITLLASRFLVRYCQEMNIEPKTLDPGALRWMMLYPWPGNVRELENEMKRLAVSVLGNVITEQDLSRAIRTRGGLDEKGEPSGNQSLKKAVEQVEKRLILSALDASGHNQVKTAKVLGLSRQGLIKKMKRYGIK